MILTEQALGPEDVIGLLSLHEGEPATYRVLVPADTERNMLVSVLDGLALGAFGDALRQRSTHQEERARTEATVALEASLAALTGAGVPATGEITADDPVPALRAAVARHQADEIYVVTRPHMVEESFHRDWASRARDELGVPVLHVYAHTGGRVG